jgi:hypothetical protein
VRLAALSLCGVALESQNMSGIKASRYAYSYATSLVNGCEQGKTPQSVICDVFSSVKLDRVTYAKVISLMPMEGILQNNKTLLNSIDSIKGQEGSNCCFVLTTDLADYLLGEKTAQNKTKNKLYVALTRSLLNLTIFVTMEVESKYGREVILKLFAP